VTNIMCTWHNLYIVNGGKHEGSKRNLKFQRATWPQAPSQYFFFPLLPSFHSPWIIVTVINYIDNKMNSIAIRFLGVVISIIGGWGGVCFLLAVMPVHGLIHDGQLWACRCALLGLMYDLRRLYAIRYLGFQFVNDGIKGPNLFFSF